MDMGTVMRRNITEGSIGGKKRAVRTPDLYSAWAKAFWEVAVYELSRCGQT